MEILDVLRRDPHLPLLDVGKTSDAVLEEGKGQAQLVGGTHPELVLQVRHERPEMEARLEDPGQQVTREVMDHQRFSLARRTIVQE